MVTGVGPRSIKALIELNQGQNPVCCSIFIEIKYVPGRDLDLGGAERGVLGVGLTPPRRAIDKLTCLIPSTNLSNFVLQRARKVGSFKSQAGGASSGRS